MVFSIATNGYDVRYRQCIRAQRAYCSRYDYDYVLVDKPARVAEPALSAWLKVPLLLSSIASERAWVMFLDADCAPQPDAPPLSSLEAQPGSVFLANGRSGRLNSGVIICRGDAVAQRFLQAVYDSYADEIPLADRAPYENGNVIHIANTIGGVIQLPQAWNNSVDPLSEDYIRHYTGPMAAELRIPLADRVMFRVARLWTSQRRVSPLDDAGDFRMHLDALASTAIATFPQLAN
jgi:hypothetical protein